MLALSETEWVLFMLMSIGGYIAFWVAALKRIGRWLRRLLDMDEQPETDGVQQERSER